MKPAFIVALIVSLASASWAEVGKWELSLAPGYAITAGNSADYLKNAASLDGGLMYGIADGISIGVEGGYVFGAKLEGTVPGRIVGDIDGDGEPDSPAFTSNVHAGVLHITPEIRFSTTLQESAIPLRPYVVAGGGYYRTHYPEGTLTLTGATSAGFTGLTADTPSTTESNGGFNMGGGLEIDLPHSLRLSAEVRYHHIIYKEDDDISFFIPALKLAWIF